MYSRTCWNRFFDVLPGSQISDKPLKDISHLMNEPQKFALIKLDKVREMRAYLEEIISSFKKEDKAKIIEKYKLEILLKVKLKATAHSVVFNVNGELDVLVHLRNFYSSKSPWWSFNIGEKHDLKVISVDKEKLQVGCSVKQLSPDPFEHIENYELNKLYKANCKNYGLWGVLRIRTGLTTLLHSSELAGLKNISAKKCLKLVMKLIA